MLKVLVVEDDMQIAKGLAMSLGFSGYEVALASTVAQAWAKIMQTHFDLLLLDVGLPDGSGIELCSRVREHGKDTPVLFLSARVDEESVVKGITAGADDYIRKPFGTEELKVRILKVLKRAGPPRNILRAGPIELDIEQRSAILAGQPLLLSPKEFDILAVFVRKAGDVVSRENILLALDESSENYDRTIDSHVSHLRKKIRDSAADTLQINAVYGVGYRLQWKAAVGGR